MKISKTLLLQSFLILFGMAILSTAGVGFYRYKAQANLKANTYAQIQIIKSAIVQPFWNMDYQSLTQIIESILTEQSSEIVSIRVLEIESPDSKPIIILDKNAGGENSHPFDSLKDHSEYIFWESPVTYRGAPLGQVQVIFSVAQPQREIAKISFFLSIGLLFFTAFCVSMFLMLHLRRYSKELQKQVEDRTRELDSQRMAMVNSSRLASLGEMSAGIAHEINNPLSVIDGTVRLISRTLAADGDAAKIENYLGKISKMVVRITKIVNGLRAFSRDGSQGPMHEFHVEHFFSDISGLCQSNLIHKNVDIQFTVETRGITLLAREVQLSQVLINMINNSADAIENLIDKWIKVECYTKEKNIVISITDSGAGIRPEVQEKMLQPFFTTKELGKGTGLGLSISIGIIESHGGRLVYCQNHQNTRFELILKNHTILNSQKAA